MVQICFYVQCIFAVIVNFLSVGLIMKYLLLSFHEFHTWNLLTAAGKALLIVDRSIIRTHANDKSRNNCRHVSEDLQHGYLIWTGVWSMIIFTAAQHADGNHFRRESLSFQNITWQESQAFRRSEVPNHLIPSFNSNLIPTEGTSI